MPDIVSLFDATETARDIRFKELSSGLWAPWPYATYETGTLSTTTDGIVMSGAVQRSSPVELESSSGARVQLAVSSSGELWVRQNTTQTVENGGAFIVQSYEEYGVVYSGSVAYTIKRFKAQVAGNTSNQSIVAAVALKSIVVLSLSEQVGPAVTTVTWLNGSGGTELRENDWGANGGQTLPHNIGGWFLTTAGTGLFLSTDAAGARANIHGTYIEV